MTAHLFGQEKMFTLDLFALTDAKIFPNQIKERRFFFQEGSFEFRGTEKAFYDELDRQTYFYYR